MGLYLTIALLLLLTAVILHMPFHRIKKERKHDILFDALDLLAKQYAVHRDIDFHIDLSSKHRQRYFHELVSYNLIKGDSDKIAITAKGVKAVLAASNTYLTIHHWTKSISVSTVIISILYLILTTIILAIPSIAVIYALSLDGWSLYVEVAAGLIILIIALRTSYASLRLYALNNDNNYKQYLITLKMSEDHLLNEVTIKN